MNPLVILAFLPERMTLERTASCGEIVAEIAKGSGRKLAVAPELANGMLLASGRDVPVETWLDRLAAALSAEWVADGKDRRKLARPPALIKRLVASDAEAIAEAIPPSPADDFDVDRMVAERKNGETTGPVDGLLVELIRALGPERLASMPTYGIDLFSNQPAPAERPLPATANAPLQSYRRTVQRMIQTLRQDEANRLNTYSSDRILEGALRGEVPERVLFVATRTVDGFFFNLTAYAPSGRIHSWAALRVPVPRPAEAGFRGSDAAWTSEKPALRPPLEEEPLELQAVPGLRKLAEGRNILVPLPDAAVTGLLKEPPRTERGFVDALANAGVSLARNEGWLMGSLSDPGGFGLRCLPRPALAQWVRRAQSPGFDPLRARSLLYFEAGDAVSGSPLDELYADQLLLPEGPLVSRWVYFTIGSMDDTTWTGFRSGRPVSMQSSVFRTRQAWVASVLSARSLQSVEGADYPDVRRIGSVAFPGGVPPGAEFSAGDLENRFVRRPGEEDWLPLEFLAQTICAGMKENTPTALKAAMAGKFELGKEAEKRFRVRYTEALFHEEESVNGEIASENRTLAYADWPEDWRKEFEGYVNEAWKELQRQGRNTAPP